MRLVALAIPLALWGLAGCSAGPSDYASMTQSATGTGVGFGGYQRYLREREAGARSGTRVGTQGGIPYSVPPQSAENPRQAPILPPASMPAVAPSTLDAVPRRPLPAAAPAPTPAPAPATAPAPVQTIATQTLAPVGEPLSAMSAPTPAPAVAEAPTTQQGIRDAQTYHADASSPAVPQGSGPAPAQIVTASIPAPSEHGGANLMEYALATSHAPGTEMHRRVNPLRWSSWQNNCLRYLNQDDAQRAFLEAGGPERDRENLDPDGDGYACWWDPTPLRQAVVASR